MAACTLTALGSGNGDVRPRPRPRSPPSAAPVVTEPRAQSQRGAVAPGMVENTRGWWCGAAPCVVGQDTQGSELPRGFGVRTGNTSRDCSPLACSAMLQKFCQLLVWKTGARRHLSGLLGNVWIVLRVGPLGQFRCSPLPVAHQDCRSLRQ